MIQVCRRWLLFALLGVMLLTRGDPAVALLTYPFSSHRHRPLLSSIRLACPYMIRICLWEVFS